MPLRLVLPKDILDEIVDNVQDVRSLRSLALTSRLFRPRSQYHLFSRHVVINNIEKLHSFCAFLEAHPDRQPWVRSVTAYSTVNAVDSPSFFNAVSRRLSQNFPNLYQWRIGSPRSYNSLISPEPLEGAYYSRVLTHLHLLGISFPSCADFARYVLAFPALRHLECRDLCLNDYGHDAAALVQAKERLSEELRLSHLTIHNIPDVLYTLLLESTRHALQELAIDSTRNYVDWSVMVPTHFPYMSKLTSITLEVEVFDRRLEQTRPHLILHAMKIIRDLASVPDSHVTHITVHLLDRNIYKIFEYLHEYSDALMRMCHALEPVLLRLPHLQKIKLSHELLLRPLQNWTSVRIEEYLPSLCERGLIDTRCSATPIQPCHNDSVSALAVSPDSRRIASSSADMTIILWDARRSTIINEWLALCDSGVGSLAFSRDGRYLASACSDEKVRVWDVSEETEARLVSTLDDANLCVWSPYGPLLAFGADTGAVQIWNPSTNQVQSHSLKEIFSAPAHRTPVFSPDGRWIALRGPMFWGVWDAVTGNLHKIFPGISEFTWPHSTTFDPAGRRIIIVSDHHVARIWDVEAGEELVVLEYHPTHGDTLGHTAFSPDGTRLLSTAWSEGRGVVTLWDASSGDVLLSFEGHEDWIEQVCFSPDGNHIASSSRDRTVKLWDARDGSCVRTFTEHDASVARVVIFSPDGETLVSGGDDGMVCIRHLRDVCPEVHSGRS